MREFVNLKLKSLLEHKTICAWCGAFISGDEKASEVTSHGICKNCVKRFFPQLKRKEEPPKEKQEESKQRDMEFEGKLVRTLREAAAATKGQSEKAVYRVIADIAESSGFKTTGGRGVGAVFFVPVKLTPDVPGSDTAVNFAFLSEKQKYFLEYTHYIGERKRRIERWALPLIDESLTEKANIPPGINRPSFDPIDPSFFQRLTSGINAWVRHAPSTEVEEAMDSLHFVLQRVFGFFHDDEIKPQGIWHQIWGTHVVLSGLRTDIRLFRSPYGEFAVQVQADETPSEDSIWYTY